MVIYIVVDFRYLNFNVDVCLVILIMFDNKYFSEWLKYLYILKVNSLKID